ncbi:hypothetical protein ACFL5Z_13875 [Planctomycetota bacterium]
MDKRPTTLGLSPDKLAGLWNIGSKAEETGKAADSDSKKTELLRDLLSGTVQPHTPKAKSGSKKQTHQKSFSNFLTDVSIDKLLQNPKTDITLLRKIKEHGKRLSEGAKSKTEYQVANTIYYAAIASALVFHRRSLTTFSFNDLEQYFLRLKEERWIPTSLRSLFKKACEYCLMRKETM